MKIFESGIVANAAMNKLDDWIETQNIDELFGDLGPENSIGDLLESFVNKAAKAVLGEELWNRTIISFEGKKGEESIDYKIAAAICSDEEMEELYPKVEALV